MKITFSVIALILSASQQADTLAPSAEGAVDEESSQPAESQLDLTPYFKNWLENNAKDPDSIKLKLITPARREDIVLKRGLLGKKRWSGVIACYRFNAKNSYGAYTGYKPAAVMLTDEQKLVVWIDSQGNDNSYRSYERQIVQNYC